MTIYQPDKVNIWALFVLDLIREFARPFFNLIFIALFFFLVVRPLLNWLKQGVEPIGSGAESTTLPDYPGGSGYRDNLSLPVTAAPDDALVTKAAASEALAETTEVDYSEAPLNYDEEEDKPEDQSDQASLSLTYGNLSKENILPLARDNMDRTMGLVRSWVAEKQPPPEDPKV